MPGQGSLIERALRADLGAQTTITGGGTFALADAATLFSALGALGPGTYVFQMPAQGAVALDIRLQGTHTTVVPTASIYATYNDGQTQKGAAVALPTYPGDSADWVASITTLRGERYVVLALVVPATATFTPTIGEFSAL